MPELSKKRDTDQTIGRSRSELTTKIHVICDAVGHPVKLGITPGQDADITQAKPLLENIDLSAFLADKAYDTDRLIDRLIQRGITPVIPPKRNRTTRLKTNFSSIRNGILLRGSSIKSISFVLSQPATINRNQPSSQPCSSPPSSFCLTDDTP